jgi:hypothetical protein
MACIFCHLGHSHPCQQEFQASRPLAHNWPGCKHGDRHTRWRDPHSVNMADDDPFMTLFSAIVAIQTLPG